MTATAKVSSTGSSQAVRLPKAFRVDVSEMWIGKNEVTGEITLKSKDDAGREARIAALLRCCVLKAIEDNPVPDDFLGNDRRQNKPPSNPFSEWEDLQAPHQARRRGDGD